MRPTALAMYWAAVTLAGALALGCGGGTGGTTRDAAAEAPVVVDDGGPDARPDGEPPDAGPADGDAKDGGQPDGAPDGGAPHARRFLATTAGGARLQSTSYHVELFVAPAVPVGAGASTGYRVTLGPGAMRNAR